MQAPAHTRLLTGWLSRSKRSRTPDCAALLTDGASSAHLKLLELLICGVQHSKTATAAAQATLKLCLCKRVPCVSWLR